MAERGNPDTDGRESELGKYVTKLNELRAEGAKRRSDFRGFLLLHIGAVLFFLVLILAVPGVGKLWVFIFFLPYFIYQGYKLARISGADGEFNATADRLSSAAADLYAGKVRAEREVRRVSSEKLEQSRRVAATRCDQTCASARQQISALGTQLVARESGLSQGIITGGWDDPSWDGWAPAEEHVRVVRIGRLLPNLERYYHHFPSAPVVSLPALLDYEAGRGIVVETDSDLDAVREMAQALVLRLLATVPPAGVRFTFIDPVSLGRNVAGFMDLERHESSLIDGKAWSDAQHIETALLKITEHMETVIQKYLREDFVSIAEYNRSARVKEAYRVVVVFDFPVNFSESSAKRLVSIMRNGPRCGVYPVVIVDQTKPLPYGFSLGDLEQFGLVLRQATSQHMRRAKEDLFQVYVISARWTDAIAMTRCLQEITGLDGDAAKRLGEPHNFPALLADGVTRSQADDISARVASVGGVVRIEAL